MRFILISILLVLLAPFVPQEWVFSKSSAQAISNTTKNECHQPTFADRLHLLGMRITRMGKDVIRITHIDKDGVADQQGLVAGDMIDGITFDPHAYLPASLYRLQNILPFSNPGDILYVRIVDFTAEDGRRYTRLPIKPNPCEASQIAKENETRRAEIEAERNRSQVFDRLIAKYNADVVNDTMAVAALLQNPYAYIDKIIYTTGIYIRNVAPNQAVFMVAPVPGLAPYVQMRTDQNWASDRRTMKCFVRVTGTTIFQQGLLTHEIPQVEEIECIK